MFSDDGPGLFGRDNQWQVNGAMTAAAWMKAILAALESLLAMLESHVA